MRAHALFLTLSLAAVVAGMPLGAQQTTYQPIMASQILASQLVSPTQASTSSQMTERERLHQSPDWALIVPHLPDPATASVATLETEGDVLHARRFPEDALDYYQYALKRGGDMTTLLNKMGVVRLEMHQTVLARALFQQCVHRSKKDSQAWNNMGAADYSQGQYQTAVLEYQHAVRLNREDAVYRANLGMAYFAQDDMQSARTQFAIAVRLDPRVMFADNDGGMTLLTLPTRDYGKLCFQVAKLYAGQGDMAQTKLWLQKAAEHGINLHAALSDDPEMRVLLKDSDIHMLLVDTAKLQHHEGASAAPTQGPGNSSLQD